MNLHSGIKYCSLSKSDVYHEKYLFSQSGAYISYLRGTRCKTEDAFFHEISASFQFPYYFGENWAAMDECLCDLEWISPSRIFVVIDDFSCMFSDQARIQDALQKRVVKYFSIMIDYWKAEGIPVEVWLNN